MSAWCDDFAASGLEEVLEWQAANRAWSKELRRRSSVLVNNRLAKLITQADYITDRDLVQEDTAECRRRAAILDVQINQRILDSPRRAS